MSISALLVKPVTSLIEEVLDKIAPDKMSESERERLKITARQLAEKELAKRDADFFDFVIRYEGQAKDMPRFIQVLRGLVRPVLTFCLAGLFGYGFVEKFDPELMDMLFKLNVISLIFWYGERAVTRTGIAQAIKFGSGKEKNGSPY